MLLLGILVGFLGCVWFGHQAVHYSKPSSFKRFHQGISPDTLYYPPFAMLENLALARWEPGKTVVIISGNSIFNGVGQPPNELWSIRLQELIGPRYVVVNLAFRGANASEAGSLVAESLCLRGIPVILVVNSTPGAGAGRPIGSFYSTYYWQALGQHRLFDFPARTAALDDWITSLPEAKRLQQKEERLAGFLENPLRFESLWHHVAYRYFFTVWNSVTRANFVAARDRYLDTEVRAGPLDHRFDRNLENEMSIVRGFSEAIAEKDGTEWKMKKDTADSVRKNLEETYPPALRPHMLAVLMGNAPFYRDRLSSSERARDEAVFADAAAIWRQAGIDCVVVGLHGFESADFHDRTHLGPEGGYKLAAIVADEIGSKFKPAP